MSFLRVLNSSFQKVIGSDLDVKALKVNASDNFGSRQLEGL